MKAIAICDEWRLYLHHVSRKRLVLSYEVQ